MYYILAAFVCAVLGTIPALIGRRFGFAAAQGGISFLLFWWILYASVPSTVWPLFGLPGLLVFIFWIISALICCAASSSEGERVPGWTFAPSIVGAVLYLLFVIGGTEFFRTTEYYSMIGTLETHEWTQDVQPKDPKHMRMSTQDNAVYLAQKAIGQDGTIGSQFEVENDEFCLQMINSELWYVAPLEFKGYAAWSSAETSPGYVMVSAENPDLQPKLVNFPEGERMRYSPSAYFDHNLERYLRNNGYLNKGLTGFSFEVDENHKAWWVVTVFEPTITWYGKKVTGVVIVDPANGAMTFYPLGQVPDWVDRVVPSDYIMNYLTWHGKYGQGWWNEFWAEKDITKPGDTSLIYGQGGQPEWVTDITSNNAKDNSLIGLVYTNSRTGKSVFYKVPGGGTNAAVLTAVDNNPQINFRKLHGADPQLYNVDGTMASVVPLFNDGHSFQGVAIVPIDDVQKVATGNNQEDALRQYEKLLSDKGEKVTLGKDRDLQVLDGTIDRFAFEPTSSGNVYYFHVAGFPHLFTGGINNSAKLPMTEKGDHVHVEYYSSDRDIFPFNYFDNLSLPLSESADQKSVRETVSSEQQSQQQGEDSRTIKDKINNMTPAQLEELKKHIPKQ